MNISKLTNFIPFKLSSLSVTGLLFVLNMPSAIPADAPGIIAQEPLQTSSTAKPNIMFILDNSGSMGSALGASTRLQVAQDSAKSIINGLGEVRVGLAEFSNNGSPYGATIIKNVADLTSTYKTELGTAIDNINDSGWTPLASALSDIGRYFANGNPTAGVTADCGGAANTNLTIHPDKLTTDTPAKADVACTTLLDTNITTTGPVTAWCQKSFAILLTDGLATEDDSDISSYLQDYDYDCDGSNSTPGGASGYTCDGADDKKTGTAPTVGGTYAYESSAWDSSDYLDDVAQALYEIDLQPALDDSNGDEIKNNLRTYVIGMADSSVSANPLLSEAAAQGGGEFLFADSAASLVSAFNQVTASIIAQTSTSSAVTFNSSTLSSQSAVYQALFNTASWSGELNSLPINGITGAIISNCTQGTDNCWKASEQLDNQTPSDRFIIVAGDNNLKHGVEFKYVHGTDDYTNLSSSSDIPQALLADLCSRAVGTTSGTSFPCLSSDSGSAKTANSEYIEDLVNYLRGENTNEGGLSTLEFRTRVSDLGDIVNSSPVFVGEPQQNWPSSGDFPTLSSSIPSTDYKTWKSSSIKNRAEVVYVASNDGMLHGFRAKDSTDANEDVNTSAGEEVFAFIPTGTFSTNNNEGLHYLADKNYTHRFYNDLSPVIADVYIDYRGSGGAATGTFDLTEATKSNPTAEWRTVLLGSQGGGGKSLYLLDVTDPLEYTDNLKQDPEKLVLWEFSDNDDSSLGYTYSKPTIAMMNNGKFAAIFGNGYNSTSCKAELFIVFLEGGLDGTWTQNTDYFKYDTGAGAPAGNCNGMSTPAVVDLDRNGTADRVYAGDLKGNLWVFDLCAEVTNNVGDCNTSAAAWGIADSNPLMYAEDASNNKQPITSKPVVSLDPGKTGDDDLIIVFGTGQYLTDADKSSTGVQRMYGVFDPDALNNTKANWNRDGGQITPDRWADTELGINAATGARIFTSTEAIGNNDYGWRMDLNDASDKERMVVNPKIRNNILFFNTVIPDDTTCSFGGSGWILSVNLANGGIPAEAVFDLDNSGTIGDAGDTTTEGIPAGQYLNQIPAESTFLGDNQYTPGSDGSINQRSIYTGKGVDEGRMSWKEMYED